MSLISRIRSLAFFTGTTKAPDGEIQDYIKIKTRSKLRVFLLIGLINKVFEGLKEINETTESIINFEFWEPQKRLEPQRAQRT